MQSYVTPLGLVLLASPLAVTAVISSLALTFFPQQRLSGWRTVIPGAAYWVAAILSFAMSALIAWVWTFVGSSRLDGPFQMRVAWWLSFVFGLCAVFAALRIVVLHRQFLRWRGETLAWNGSGGNIAMSTLETMKTTPFGFTHARFNTGKRVSIDLGASGASELIEKIEDVNGLAPPDRPGEH